MTVKPAMNSVAQPSLAAGSPGIPAQCSGEIAPSREQGCSPHPQAGKPALRCRAFTLIEMLVVIAIIGIIAGLSVPALVNMKKSDAAAAATRQLLDDVARARQLAISQRSTVYMVFVPRNFWDDNGHQPNATAYNALSVADKSNAVNLLDKQLIGYNFVSLREVGGQPGQSRPKYLTEWRTLPEGMFIPEYKFTNRAPATAINIRDTSGATPIDHYVNGFAVTNVIPFPTADALPSPTAGYAWLPYLAFNHLGQLVSDLDEEVIPLARGTANPSLDVNKRPLYAPPALQEKPPGNSMDSGYTLVYVDRLTGRARVERQKIQ